MDILRQGVQVEVTSPASLRKMVSDRLRDALSTYEAP
jgi:predicted DNA-binding transcriptional regulator YafY